MEYDIVALEFHEKGQSMINSDINWNNVLYLRRNKDVEITFNYVTTVSVNDPNQPCNEQDSHSVSECVDHYIENKLGCKLPWLPTGATIDHSQMFGKIVELIPDNTEQRQCDSIKDKDNFVKLIEKLDGHELTKAGCFAYNCMRHSWSIAKTTYFHENSNDSKIQFMFEKSQPVTVFKSSIAYGFSNFVADFGGYLGLLLGASILSIYDCFTDKISILFNTKA